MENIISIKQELIYKGGRAYDVIMTVDRGDSKEEVEHNFTDCNGIYPLYRSLIDTLRDIEDAHVDLTTENDAFVNELNGSPNRNSKLLSMFNDIKQIQGVTVNAITQ